MNQQTHRSAHHRPLRPDRALEPSSVPQATTGDPALDRIDTYIVELAGLSGHRCARASGRMSSRSRCITKIAASERTSSHHGPTLTVERPLDHRERPGQEHDRRVSRQGLERRTRNAWTVRDDKPFFIQGPRDNGARIMNTLHHSAGGQLPLPEPRTPAQVTGTRYRPRRSPIQRTALPGRW